MNYNNWTKRKKEKEKEVNLVTFKWQDQTDSEEEGGDDHTGGGGEGGGSNELELSCVDVFAREWIIHTKCRPD